MIKRLLLPGGAILVAAWAVVVFGDEVMMLQLTAQYRWVVYGLTAALAGGFHRSRIFTVVLGLGALDLATGDAPELDAMGALGSIFFIAVGVLSLSRDRGVASTTGALQVIGTFILVLIPGVIFLDSVNVGSFMTLHLLPGWMTDWTGYAQPVVVAAAIGIGATGYAVYRWRGVVEYALLWTQLTMLSALHWSVTFPEDSVFLMAAGIVLAVAVLQTTYAMAYQDDLTGLPARRALMRDLGELGGTYALAMADVDHFKQFNDKHGHDVGDQVLKLVAGRLAKAPDGGKAYRYGGEEFTIVYPGKTAAEAADSLEAVRASVESAKFALRSWKRPREKPEGPVSAPDKPKVLSVTISIGLADSTMDDAIPDRILKKADQALYRAKEDGRNRVSL